MQDNGSQSAPSLGSRTPFPFHVMLKPIGSICNLNCSYCYYLSKDKLYPAGERRMSLALLEKFTQQYIESQPHRQMTFTWQGGEPTLLGVDFYQAAVDLQRKYQKPGMILENSLQTNATQLDEAWGRFLAENRFLVGVSLDGPASLHDVYRRDKAGRPTHAKVMQGMAILKEHEVDFNILACVHHANVGHPLEVYRFFRDEVGAGFIQFIPIVQRDNKTGFQEGERVTKRSLSGREYGSFLKAIFDEWVQVDVGKVFVQIFDVALARWLGEPAGLCVFEETCGQALVLEHNGDLYSCDHFVEPSCRLGSIQEKPLLELVASPEQLRFGYQKRDWLPSQCRACDVRFVCNGGCPKNRISKAADGELGLNILCEGYQAFFRHIDRPMSIMAYLLRNGRPAAEIMSILREP